MQTVFTVCLQYNSRKGDEIYENQKDEKQGIKKGCRTVLL